ncbi:SPOR domain-containing protein [Coleofasciculus sp. FACHB-1120]|uniref:SPOR domain-containing protein n=1 Tax=Coleofasciculus sp. FACHB-1120 TaxID=2692783 RepID=UPI001688582F|nr:SPOR domain-containing protein [Coleofasciculus sp. FACHB-1120]MBD2741374.1 hypothetical protein [Coleofasciculus sp. FACHB-1120]
MSQGHSVESSTRPSPAQSINPALQAALGSLDVQLEEELSRYRRERGGRGTSPAPRMNHDRVRNKPIDLISVTATGGRNQSPTPPPPPPSPAAPPPAAPPPPPPASVPPQAANLEGKGVETTIQNQNQNQTWYTPPGPASSFDLSAPSAELATLTTPPQEPDWHPEPAANPPEFVNPTATHVPPNDYLESSEQLLRSLVEEEASTPRRSERSFLDSLLTPLGVGSMLLLLFSTATLGYLVTNPGSLSFLGFDRFGESETPTVTQNPTATTPTATTPTTNAPAAGAAPSGPNLATDEFVDVNLDTLSTLPSSSPPPRSNVAGLPKTQVAVPTISPLPSSPTPGNSSAGQSGSVPLPGLPPAATVPLTPASPLPGLPQRLRSGQPSVQPSVKPSPTAAATPAPNPEGFYYVFVKYNGESSLQQARKVVPDAYLSPEGTQIYLGAFKKESQAQTLVKELQTQGISAAVDQP